MEPPSGATSSVTIIDEVLEPHLEVIREMIPLEPSSGARTSVICNNLLYLGATLEIITEMIPLEPPSGANLQ